MSLLDDVSIVVTPNGYKAGELYAVVPVPTEGAEEITNGDFATDTDWTKGTGWTISGGTANCNNTSGSTQDLKTENRILNLGGKTVKIEFTVSNYSGSATMIVTLQGTGGNDFTGINANGTYTAYASVQLSENSIDLLFKASNGWIGSIDNVSVKEYTAADMDVTRATAGTRVDEDGLVNYAEVIGDELVTNGDFATDSDWSVTQSGNDTITIENGYALFNCPDNSNIYISQGGLLTIGKTYIASVDLLSIDSGSLQFAQGGGGTITGSPSINTLGTHTFTFIAATATFAVKRKLGAPNLLNAKIDNVSVKEVTRDNVPRIDYTGGGCPHILAEPQRRNLVEQSESISNLSSNTNGTGTFTITDNYTDSPQGVQNASRVQMSIVDTDDTNNYRLINTGSVMSTGVTRKISFYAKSLTGSNQDVLFYWSYDQQVVTLTNDWQRFKISATSGNTGSVFIGTRGGSGNYFSGGDANLDFAIWGLQVEDDGSGGGSSYATSYIPTSGSTVTRNQDIFTRDGIGSLINDSEGVLFAEISRTEDESNYRLLGLDNGTSQNYIKMGFGDISGNFWIRAVVNGVTVINSDNAVSNNANQFYKIAVKYKSGDSVIYIDGVPVLTSSTTFSSGTFTDLDFTHYTGSLNFYGKVKQLQVYKTADIDLAALTS